MTDGATDKDFHTDKESVIQETQQALICIHQVAEFKRTDRREARRVLLVRLLCAPHGTKHRCKLLSPEHPSPLLP